MITEKELELLSERLVNRIEEITKYTYEIMGNRIKEIGKLSQSDVQRLKREIIYSQDLNKITKKISDITKSNIEDVYAILDEVAKQDYEFAEIYYKAKGMDFIPYTQNRVLKSTTKALATITAKEMKNFSKTLGFAKITNGKVVYTPLSKAYQEAIDKAILTVTTGVKDYQSAMYSTIKDLSDSGIRTIDYASGYSRRLDSSVRQSMITGITQVNLSAQQIAGEEFGADGYEISVHSLCAEDHQNIQGKQFSKKEYEKLNDSLERPIGTLNCRHFAYSIILGVNKPQYTAKQLQRINNESNKIVEYEGKKYTKYEATQVQRKLETEIRRQKDAQILGKSSANKKAISKAQNKITVLTNKYKDFSSKVGLDTKLNRLRVSGYKRVAI